MYDIDTRHEQVEGGMGTHIVSDLVLGSEVAEASVFTKFQREARAQQQREMEREEREKRRETCKSHRDREHMADSQSCAMLTVPVLTRRCCVGRVL